MDFVKTERTAVRGIRDLASMVAERVCATGCLRTHRDEDEWRRCKGGLEDGLGAQGTRERGGEG